MDAAMETLNDAAPKLRLRGVRKEFVLPRTGERTVALEEIDLDVKRGEFLCIVGPSGCGKTTILNMIAGLTAPTGGSLEIDGKPIDGPGAERGVVFQDYGKPCGKTSSSARATARVRRWPRASATSASATSSTSWH
jgi:ABC-type glutathione transport system ATPase component